MAALTFSFDTLRTGGHFLCKFYQGAEDKAFEQKLKRLFKKVHREKPESSRSVWFDAPPYRPSLTIPCLGIQGSILRCPAAKGESYKGRGLWRVRDALLICLYNTVWNIWDTMPLFASVLYRLQYPH